MEIAMKLKVLKNFSWAHRHVHVKEYVKGQVIDTEDEDLIAVATKEKWVQEAGSKDVDAQIKSLTDEINALSAKLDEAEDAQIAGIEAQLKEKQAELQTLQA